MIPLALLLVALTLPGCAAVGGFLVVAGVVVGCGASIGPCAKGAKPPLIARPAGEYAP